jgi:hypothetical protein
MLPQPDYSCEKAVEKSVLQRYRIPLVGIHPHITVLASKKADEAIMLI